MVLVKVNGVPKRETKPYIDTSKPAESLIAGFILRLSLKDDGDGLVLNLSSSSSQSPVGKEGKASHDDTVGKVMLLAVAETACDYMLSRVLKK